MILDSAGIFWTHPSSHPTYEIVAPFAFKEDSDRLSFAIGIGTESGFDTSYRIGQFTAHHLVQALSNNTQPPNEAFSQAARVTDNLLKANPLFNGEGAACSVLGGVIERDQAWISWLGTETAWHFRHASLIAATTPHTFGNALAAVGHPLHPDNAAMANIAHRALRSESELDISQIEMLESPWSLLSGDTLIFATIDMTMHLTPQQVAHQLEGKDALHIAHVLLDMLPAGEKHYGAAAIVICVKDA